MNDGTPGADPGAAADDRLDALVRDAVGEVDEDRFEALVRRATAPAAGAGAPSAGTGAPSAGRGRTHRRRPPPLWLAAAAAAVVVVAGVATLGGPEDPPPEDAAVAPSTTAPAATVSTLPPATSPLPPATSPLPPVTAGPGPGPEPCTLASGGGPVPSGDPDTPAMSGRTFTCVLGGPAGGAPRLLVGDGRLTAGARPAAGTGGLCIDLAPVPGLTVLPGDCTGAGTRVVVAGPGTFTIPYGISTCPDPAPDRPRACGPPGTGPVGEVVVRVEP